MQQESGGIKWREGLAIGYELFGNCGWDGEGDCKIGNLSVASFPIRHTGSELIRSVDRGGFQQRITSHAPKRRGWLRDNLGPVSSGIESQEPTQSPKSFLNGVSISKPAVWTLFVPPTQTTRRKPLPLSLIPTSPTDTDTDRRPSLFYLHLLYSVHARTHA